MRGRLIIPRFECLYNRKATSTMCLAVFAYYLSQEYMAALVLL
jgi:hypothetical protein